MIFGGGYNKYEGNHFGKVIWARYASTSEKIVIMTIMLQKWRKYFCESNYQIANKLSLFGDLQLRNVHYKANGAETGMVNDNFNFFNPKV
jgi:iron complex outermembrane receptor protein